MPNQVAESRRRWRVLGVSALMALTLVATVAIGLAPRAAAHRQTASSQMKLPPVILPTYYDGIETQTVDQTAHPQDPPNTYRVDTHYNVWCEMEKRGVGAP